jgi:general nucleoside transport system permease protein
MTEEVAPAHPTDVVEPALPSLGGAGPDPSRRSRRASAFRDAVIRSVVPVILALVAGGVLLWILGTDPIKFYSDVWHNGIDQGAWQDSLMLAAPLLLIAVGLILIFRANLWQLGYDGQYLLAAVMITGLGPDMTGMPKVLFWIVMFLLAGVVGALWTLVPALLKAYYETNEIITTLMMSFIGIDLANILVKGPFQDPTVSIPQTKTIPFNLMLPYIPGTRVDIGVIIAFIAPFLAYWVLKRTSFGLRLHVLGANPRAASHVGIDVKRLIINSFLVSGAFVGIAAFVDILGVWGYVRSNWNPAYGDTVIPFVFLARLNPIAVIPFVLFFAILSNGGDLAAANTNIPTDFLLVLVALILLFMTVIEYFGRQRDLGQSYVPPGLRQVFQKPILPWRRRAREAQP